MEEHYNSIWHHSIPSLFWQEVQKVLFASRLQHHELFLHPSPPQCNSQTEASNKTIIDGMKKILEGVMGNWLTHKSTPRSRDGKMGQNFLTQPIWPVTRLTRLKMTRFDLWLVLTRDPIDSTRTQLDLPVLQCLPTLSRLRLKCNSYKIFTYSSLLNMLCTPL